ncbi:MAG: hypothetical protein HYW47_06490 [Deltaproteobacteria bacterium]|nr:hypothetical protein [Deltaproteobacteria bacterium]
MTNDVLFVDADRGGHYETDYIEALNLANIPFTYWNVEKKGVPTLLDFQKHRVILWITDTSNTGIPFEGAYTLAKHLQLKGKVIVMGYQTGASLREMWLDEAFFGFKYEGSSTSEKEVAHKFREDSFNVRTDFVQETREGFSEYEIVGNFHDGLYGKTCAVKTQHTYWLGFDINDIESKFTRAQILYKAVNGLMNK